MVLSIQYLRGIAALMVVLRHISFKDNQYGQGIFQFEIGDMGVDIFFIISGFIMYYIMVNKENGLNTIIEFIKHRIVRILPLYWVLTTVGLVIYLIMPNSFSRAEAPDILGSYLLIPWSNMLLDPAWTLSYEFYFYFIFAIGLLFNKNRILIVNLILIFLVFFGLYYSLSDGFGVLKFYTNSLLLEFFFGVIIAYLFMNTNFKLKTRLIISSASFLFFLFFIFLNIYEYKLDIRGLDLGLPALCIVVSLVFLEKEIKKFKINFFKTMGDISYSLYLTHAFVLAAMGIVFNKVVYSEFTEIAYLFCMLIVSVVIGFLTYIIIEKNLISFFRKKFN